MPQVIPKIERSKPVKKSLVALLTTLAIAGCATPPVQMVAPQPFTPPVSAAASSPTTQNLAKLRQYAIQRWDLWFHAYWDFDGDRRVDWEEAQGAGFGDNPPGRDLFRRLDIDGDGYITFEEFKDGPLIDDDIRFFILFGRKMATRLDENGDQWLTYQEYINDKGDFSFEIKTTPLVKQPNPNIRSDAFALSDLNRDGFLNIAECELLLGWTMAAGYVHSFSYTGETGPAIKKQKAVSGKGMLQPFTKGN